VDWRHPALRLTGVCASDLVKAPDAPGKWLAASITCDPSGGRLPAALCEENRHLLGPPRRQRAGVGCALFSKRSRPTCWRLE
jgi:hypothetical protein